MNSKNKSLIQDYEKIKTLEVEYYKLCKKYASFSNFESAPLLTQIQLEISYWKSWYSKQGS